MENPATWTPTHKLISAALDFKSEAIVQAASVFDALVKADLLKEKGDRGSPVLGVIAETIEHYQKLTGTGFCGQSLQSMLVTKLINIDVLK